MKFESLNLVDDLLRGVADAGFERCTPIQEQALPECLAGKDVIAQSQTGSGKTAVFVLTIFNRLVADGYAPAGKPKALIMVPTRELATQVESDARLLGKHVPVRSVAIYGGVQYDKQVGALKEGVDVVVATPGRMIDLFKSKTLSLDEIDVFVIDEADRMFDMGFAPDIRYIASKLPRDRSRQTLLFSATIDSNVQRLSSNYMKPDLVEIEIEPEQVTVEAIDQKVIYTSNEEKLSVLMALLSRDEAERVIIFTNMKRTAEMLGFKLAGNDFPAEVLTGDVSQSKRERIIRDVKSGKVKCLVATDVAARGLHIENVSHVINYDLPEEAANYVHRIGRTARAGKSGRAYSLACEDYVLNLPEIEKFIEQKIEKEWLEESELVPDKAGRYYRRRSSGSTAAGGRPSRGSAPGGRSGTGTSGRKPARRPARPSRGAKPATEKPAGAVEASTEAPRPAATAQATAESAGAAVEARPAASGEQGGEAKRPRRRRPRGPRRRGPKPEGAAQAADQGSRPSSDRGAEGAKGSEVRRAGGQAQGTDAGEKRTGPPRRRRRPGAKLGHKPRTGPKPEGRQGATSEKRSAPATTRPEPATMSTGSRLDPYRSKYSPTSSKDLPGGKGTGSAPKKEGVLKKVLNVFRKKS